MNKSLLNKIILFTIVEYLEKQMLDEESYQRDAMRKIVSSINGWKTFHRFSRAEAELVGKWGQTEAMTKLREVEVDYSIYALELLQLYVTLVPKKQRAHLGISDAKITMLKANLIKDMLRLKQRGGSYDRIKDITDQSRLVAKRFFHYFDEQTNKQKDA